MANRSQRLQAVVRGAVNQLSCSATRRADAVTGAAASAGPEGAPAGAGNLGQQDHAAEPGAVAAAVTDSDYANLTAMLHAGFTRSAQHRNDEYLHEDLWMVAAGLPEPLVLALSAYLTAPEAPGSPLAQRAIPAAAAADVALLPIWSPSSGTGAPSPDRLRRLLLEVGADLAVDFDIYWCDDCTLTDTPADDTHWLIEVATIRALRDLTAAQQAALVAVAETCGADVDEGSVTYVGAGRACPPGCSAHQDHRGDCRPRGGSHEAGAAMSTDVGFLYDHVEDAVRAAVTTLRGRNAYQNDQPSAWTLRDFPPTLLEALHPVIDPAGLNRGHGNRPWFTVTLPMRVAARIIVNYCWAPELDIFDSAPDGDDHSGYYVIPAPMAARWLLSSTPTLDQHWMMRLRFTDLANQKRPSGINDHARSTANPAHSTGTWTVGIDWIRVTVNPHPGASTRELTHRARNVMLASIGWSSFSQDVVDQDGTNFWDGMNFWRECGVIDFRDALHTTGPQPGDVCDCGVPAGGPSTTSATSGTGAWTA